MYASLIMLYWKRTWTDLATHIHSLPFPSLLPSHFFLIYSLFLSLIPFSAFSTNNFDKSEKFANHGKIRIYVTVYTQVFVILIVWGDDKALGNMHQAKKKKTNLSNLIFEDSYSEPGLDTSCAYRQLVIVHRLTTHKYLWE